MKSSFQNKDGIAVDCISHAFTWWHNAKKYFVFSLQNLLIVQYLYLFIFRENIYVVFWRLNLSFHNGKTETSQKVIANFTGLYQRMVIDFIKSYCVHRSIRIVFFGNFEDFRKYSKLLGAIYTFGYCWNNDWRYFQRLFKRLWF